jgi:UDP-N-acetylglucosamine--N-acetylmuramyl-(pentapeptide) pyrophosphoryl-undecaprenol N-acetylglucosamine transferase
MRIVFTGGGTGGHFYPIIAIAKALRKKGGETAELYYFSTEPYSQDLLDGVGLSFRKVPAGKWRRYFSFRNFSDIFVTLWGILVALVRLFLVYPDVVFGKGGYPSFPVLVAARILFIPVIIHESDAHPGRVNMWAGKFAERIALSYQEAGDYFPKERVAWTGQPIRENIEKKEHVAACRSFGLSETLPVIGVLGGSLGAVRVNEGVLDALPKLLENYQVLHQTGEKNYSDVMSRVGILLEESNLNPVRELAQNKSDGQASRGALSNGVKKRYHAVAYLDDESLTNFAGASDLIITRAGSTLFEIAHWGIPAIVVPIPEDVSHDQTRNAVAFGRTGAGIVLEQANFTPNILLSEIKRILNNPTEKKAMQEAAARFDRPEADSLLAEEIFSITKSHE